MSRPSKSRSYPRKASQPQTVRERVATYRKRMRARGYRPVEIWVPDTGNPKFVARLRREARAIARVERGNKKLMAWLDVNTADLVGQIEQAEQAAGIAPPAWDPKAERPL